jgi:hypothetical protein
MAAFISGATRIVIITVPGFTTLGPPEYLVPHFDIVMPHRMVHHLPVKVPHHRRERCEMSSKPQQERGIAATAAPAWAIKLLAEMQARKAAATAPVFSAGLRAAAARQQARQQTKGHGSAYGAAKFTGAW